MDWTDWPGKSAREPDGVEHPAICHLLDVAAVAERLIAPLDFAPPLRDALVLLVALHDLGKFSESFRRMLREGIPQGFRHWELTEVLLYEHDNLLSERLGGESWHRQLLYGATAGHHGRPPTMEIGGLAFQGRRSREYSRSLKVIADGRRAASEALGALTRLWPEASLDGMTDAHAVALSWWLPGFCAAADWIGSNAEWFGPKPAPVSLKDYLANARDEAASAVSVAGISGQSVSDAVLFDFALRPMQVVCQDIALPEGPTLAIIEDETGAGKTEAALLLAQRMLRAGKGRGVFFALPTMATADAMFRRARSVVPRLFDASPTLTLAHGRAGLSRDFRDVSVNGGRSEDDATCTDWLAENRRRALLADVGIGTIDQALLSVLPVRFQALRHFGLSSKVLIVDEVHEMGEAYIATELEALLQMHRAAGGSAILLTATLPLAQRARLLSVYGGRAEHANYPALTIASGAAVTSFPKDDRPTRGPVSVQKLEDNNEAVELIAHHAAQGAACVWVRNAVDDAIAAVQELRSRGVSARLLHARFTLADRKRIETEIAARVGKDGTGRAGFVLVGTQVLESSLDFDFDVMVSDLAPMAALIQRAGRLWRHMALRPADTRPVSVPCLHVLAPDPDRVSNERWLHEVLDSGAYVYPVADQWRTARVLFRDGRIDAPATLRALIEAVHGATADPAPEVLERAEMKAVGEAVAHRGHAAQNIVDYASGYRMGARASDDADYPTRLGVEQRILVLARRTDRGLRSWAEQESDEAWALSEVSASRRRLDALPLPDQSEPEIMAVTQDWPDWKRAQYRLCPVGEGGLICEGLRYDPEVGLIFTS
ncbi:CRISPR-associated helicase Cas3' [Thioclava sp. ES.032]|uniref:CRISPR-associated helicase Cas3' n=1 Tax=Thioclava sp. JE_KL1 TaxID=2651187 RepID=UPI0010671E26|nr:CRISPR-associated helicase Cas3' [Thioclava sp. JE_KL1]